MTAVGAFCGSGTLSRLEDSQWAGAILRLPRPVTLMAMNQSRRASAMPKIARTARGFLRPSNRFALASRFRSCRPLRLDRGEPISSGAKCATFDEGYASFP